MSKFLDRLDDLEKSIPSTFLDFLDMFRDFKQVIDSTFGCSVDENYVMVLQKLRESFDVLKSKYGVSENVKMHIILTHVSQLIEKNWERIRRVYRTNS